MIPAGWVPFRRRSDDELVGYLVGGDGFFEPVSLIGTSLGPRMSRGESEGLLTEDGLATLDQRWFARLPRPVTPELDATDPPEEWAFRPVVIIEVSPTGCSIRPALPFPDEVGVAVRLPVPVGDLLFSIPPE